MECEDFAEALQNATSIEFTDREGNAILHEIMGRDGEMMEDDSEEVCLYTKGDNGNEHLWHFKEVHEASMNDDNFYLHGVMPLLWN